VLVALPLWVLEMCSRNVVAHRILVLAHIDHGMSTPGESNLAMPVNFFGNSADQPAGAANVGIDASANPAIGG
jgi:hypothetical protein